MQRILQPTLDRPGTLSRVPQALLLALLAVAIVGAQLVGLVHRVEHGGGQAALAALLLPHEHGEDCRHDPPRATSGSESSPEHNCAAIDALTLGDGPLLAVHAQAADVQAAQRVAIVAERQAGRTAYRLFDARAPPAFS